MTNSAPLELGKSESLFFSSQVFSILTLLMLQLILCCARWASSFFCLDLWIDLWVDLWVDLPLAAWLWLILSSQRSHTTIMRKSSHDSPLLHYLPSVQSSHKCGGPFNMNIMFYQYIDFLCYWKPRESYHGHNFVIIGYSSGHNHDDSPAFYRARWLTEAADMFKACDVTTRQCQLLVSACAFYFLSINIYSQYCWMYIKQMHN